MTFFVRIHKRCGKTPMAQADLADLSAIGFREHIPL